ncbi:MAG: hypothetical protein ACOC7S_02745 [Planctomycetota bacterium]
MRMRVSLARSDYTASAPILVRADVKNVTDEKVYLTRFEHMWDAEARDQMGYLAPITYHERYLRGRTPHARSGGHHGGYLAPGESEARWLLLDRLVDLTKSGTYTVTVKRYVPDGEGAHRQLPAPPVTVRINRERSIDQIFQRLALEGDSRVRAELTPVAGSRTEEYISTLAGYARGDEVESVRQAARAELEGLRDRLDEELAALGQGES